jgi:hypothetical protein
MGGVPNAVEGLTAPAAAAALVLGDPRELPGELWVTVGARTEVDLAAVARCYGPEAAERIGDLWLRTRRMMITGSAGAGPETVETLVDVAQDTGRVKRDLVAEMDALAAHPVLSTVCDQLLGPEPPAGAPELGMPVAFTSDGTVSTVTVELRGPAWPTALGAAAAINEVSRVFTLEARHAAWRDRKSRRLARLLVESRRVWAPLEPAG